MKKTISLFLFNCLLISNSFALNIENDSVFIRVIDVGPGLSAVIRFPGDHYMIYDAGHWNGEGKAAIDGISEVIPDGSDIELLVLSHSDADHQGAVKKVIDKYNVKRVLRGGLERTSSNTWVRGNQAISDASDSGETLDVNLKFTEFPMGATYKFGDAFVTMVSGFYAPPDDWDISGGKSGSEFRNAGSIVIRIQFGNKSILFTGDAVGRHINDPNDSLIASEKFMVDNSDVIKISSDVLIAPHHGADNGSSNGFIDAVDPKWVVFSAGHKHKHPWRVAAHRYVDHGVALDHMFRTDIGDDESGGGEDKEWSQGRVVGNKDGVGDDDVDILLRPNGEVLVEYRLPH